MILERKQQLNVTELKEQYSHFIQLIREDSPQAERERWPLLQLTGVMQAYNAAMKEISTKLEILDDAFHVNHSHNPIHHLECRIKGIQSIYDKMLRYQIPFTLDAARERVQDIAGIRVICNFLDDIYIVEELLLQQTDISLIKRKDYIENPKPNGYRSLHLVVKVPVYLPDRTETVPVEIQLRTIAMDYWASLEHMLSYKNNNDEVDQYATLLKDCAETLARTEKDMQFIRESIDV